MQNSCFLAVGCGLNKSSCFRSDFVVLDGCLNCGDADRGSRRFAVTCGPMGRIAILGCFEYECGAREDTHYSSVPSLSLRRIQNVDIATSVDNSLDAESWTCRK